LVTVMVRTPFLNAALTLIRIDIGPELQ
jgi:hypothetical protein